MVGHYKAIHQQELYKPAETMWLSVEMWDELAKKNYAETKKGRPVRGVGYVIQNKWTDKDTGEERKMYKVRITKVLNLEEFDTIHELLEDSDGTRQATSFTPSTDSGFASDFPDPDDQTTVNGSRPTVRDVATSSSYGYSYKKRSSTPTQKAAHAPPQDNLVPQPSHVPPPGSGDGQKVWESLKNSYPGMIKSDNKINSNTRPVDRGPEWG